MSHLSGLGNMPISGTHFPDVDSGFSTTGLPDEIPDDFHTFMSDVLRDEPPVTDADLDAMWAAEQQRRDDERRAVA